MATVQVDNEVIPKLTAWLTINRACNLRCNWCYAKMTKFKAKDSMSLDLVRKILAMLKDLKLESVILIGGEPTIHPNFLEIVKLITESGMKANLVTNALRFSDKKFLDMSLDAGISAITVSLKASNPEDYRLFTERDVFDSAIEAITNIGLANVPHVINVTACETIVDKFDEMIEIVEKSKARTFSVDTGKPIVLNGQTYMDGMWSPKRMAEFFTEIYPILEKSNLRFSIKVAVPFCLFSNRFIDKIIEDGNIMAGCQMASGKGIIFAPNGELVPCNHLCNLSLGKFGEDFSSGSEYISFRRRKEIVDFYRVASSSPHNKCLKCKYWSMCGAGCKLYWFYYDETNLIGNFERR